MWALDDSGRYCDMRSKLLLFSQPLMRFNVRFTSTSPHTAILLTDGSIQIIVLFIVEKDTFGFTFP